MSAPFAVPGKTYPEVQAGGLRVACLGRAQLAALMVRECLEARALKRAVPKLVFGLNGQAISLAARNAEFRRFHDMADHVHADGQPVVVASRMFASPPIPERSPVTDFFHDAAEAAQANGLRFFLLGATEEINAVCADIMTARYPRLVIAGRRDGYFPIEDETAICDAITAAQADVVWVGLGIPLEQGFCVRNRHRIRAGWLVAAGGCFNYVTGRYGRAPKWMQHFCLEWLYRLCREPVRLFWRYALTNPHALFLLLTRTSALKSSQAAWAKRKAGAAGTAG